jgi:Lsr2
MAKKIIQTTEYTDDLDGSTAAGTVTFGYDGASYEIDLSRANTRAFEKALKPYVEAGRKVRGTRTRTSTRGRSTGKRDLAAIRAWASQNGHDVSGRGRIARTVVDAYDAAH